MSTLTIGIILAFVAGLFSFLDKWKKSTHEGYKRNNIFASIAFSLLIAGLCLNWYSGQKAEQDKVTREKVSAAKDAELINQITGGSSTPRLQPFLFGKDEKGLDKIGFEVFNDDTTNIPNVLINFNDVVAILSVLADRPSNLAKSFYSPDQYLRSFEIPLLYKGSAKQVFITSFPKKIDSASYTIDVNWKAGYYRCNIDFKRNPQGRIDVKKVGYFDVKSQEFHFPSRPEITTYHH